MCIRDRGSLTLRWEPTRDDPDGDEEVYTPAMLDQRALFCLEECTKRSRLQTLDIRGGCLGAWGTAFVARGARIEGAGLEVLSLVDCRLRAEGAASVASLLSRGSKLVDVDLSGNGIGDDGMNELAKELAKNEYLEKLRLGRNRISNKRMNALGSALGGHPVLRTLDLSHNLISYQGATHLANGLRESVSLQHLSIAHNKCKADAVYRLANVCTGHETMSTLDCRGTPLRKNDRKRLDAHTSYTRLQIFIDPPPEAPPVDIGPLVIEENAPSADGAAATETGAQGGGGGGGGGGEGGGGGDDDEPRVAEVDDDDDGAPPPADVSDDALAGGDAKPKLTEVKSIMPGVKQYIDESTSEPTKGRDADDASLPSSLLHRTDMLPADKGPPPDERLTHEAAGVKLNKSVGGANWKLPAGDISTREWVTGFAQLGLY